MSDENLISKQLNDGELVEVALAFRLKAHAIRLKRDHGGIWGEHPEFPVEDWATEAINNDTRLGYWEWVCMKLEEEVDAPPSDMTQYELRLFNATEGDEDA